jgi:NitT/TauT family transport system substrate-binding protein
MNERPAISRHSALASAFGLLALSQFSAPAGAQAQTTVRIGSATADSFAEPYFAADQGFFTRAGIDAPITTFSAGGPIVQAAAAGAIDVGIGDVIAVANAVHAGVPFALFAGGGLYSSDAPTSVLCVAAGSPLRTPKDLAGQTIAVANFSSITTVGVKAWLEANGVDLTTVRFYELPQAEMAAAILRGTVTAAFIAETYFAGQRDKLRIFAQPYDTVAKQFLISGWFASRDWLAHNAPGAKQLADAIYATARWSNDHQDQTAAVLSKLTGMDVARIRSIHRVRWAASLDGRLIQPVLDVATRYKLLDTHMNAADIMV